jgi:MiaB/RimO family radical SAM methylthiotransferase
MAMGPAPKKYFVLTTTEGCATNLLENAAHRKRYEGLGYEPAQDAETADVILVNTCAYNGLMEDRAVGTLSDLQTRFEGKEIVLSGCLPKINPTRVKEVFKGSVVESPKPSQSATAAYHQFDRADFRKLSFKHRLILKLRPLYFSLEERLGFQFHPLHNIFKSVVVNEKFYLLTVATGCVGQCTFCAIKRSKGKLISRPLAVVLEEFQAGLANGYRDFWLLGDDIGCWGQDLNLSVADLLRSMLARPEKFSIVLNYLDPHFMLKYEAELRGLLTDPRVICINVPLQSASPKILKAMKRDYEPRRVYKMLSDVKAKNPGLAVKTNVMVGFPGENWLDFFRSQLSVFAFDAIVAMKYSPRPHTSAAKYDGQVASRTKSARFVLINMMILFRHFTVATGALFRRGRIV